MAPPDKKRQGSEKGQREHAGRTSEASDAGMQTRSQGARGEGPVESDDARASDTQRSLVSPVERSDADGPVVDRDMDRATGEGEAPAGEAREREGRSSMSDRGMEQSGDRRAGDARTTDAEPGRSRR
jgi:hypothetical protein